MQHDFRGLNLLFLFISISKRIGVLSWLALRLVYYGPVWHIIYPAKSQIKKTGTEKALVQFPKYQPLRGMI